MDTDNNSIQIYQASVAAGHLKMPAQSSLNMLPLKILFLNGYGTQRGGVIPDMLRDHGHFVIEPDLPDNSFPRSVTIAQRVFNRHQPDFVVGWSRGGAVAMSIDIRNASLLLVAPAWKNWGTMANVMPEVTIFHSPHDELVPIGDSRELLQNSGLSEDRLVAVGENHRMCDEASLLAVCECAHAYRKKRLDRQAA